MAVGWIPPSLAVDWKLLPVLCHTGFSIRLLIAWQLAFSEQEARRAKERLQARGKLDFCHFIL